MLDDTPFTVLTPRQARTALEMTGKAMSAALGCSMRHYASLDAGTLQPRRSETLALAALILFKLHPDKNHLREFVSGQNPTAAGSKQKPSLPDQNSTVQPR